MVAKGVSTWPSPALRCSQGILLVHALEELGLISLCTQIRWTNLRTVCAESRSSKRGSLMP